MKFRDETVGEKPEGQRIVSKHRRQGNKRMDVYFMLYKYIDRGGWGKYMCKREQMHLNWKVRVSLMLILLQKCSLGFMMILQHEVN